MAEDTLREEQEPVPVSRESLPAINLLARLSRRELLRFLSMAGAGLFLTQTLGCRLGNQKPVEKGLSMSGPTSAGATAVPLVTSTLEPATATPSSTATVTPVPPTPTANASRPVTPSPTSTLGEPTPTPAVRATAAAGPAINETVGLARGVDVDTIVKQAVAEAGGLGGVVARGSTVVIKVNLTMPAESGSGIVTDRRVVKAVIELCKAAGAGKVVICDGAGGANGDTTAAMKSAGYESILSTTGATFVDLNSDAVVTVSSPGKLALADYRVAKTVAQAATFISLAVLKTHNEAGVSLTAKNLVGITPLAAYTDAPARARYRLHDAGIHKVIADLNLLRRVDFAIIDGITGMEGNGPIWGPPVQMNLIVAGCNVACVDAVGTAVMGFQPSQIPHLALLAAKGLGPIDLRQILVRGATIDAVSRKFKPPG